MPNRRLATMTSGGALALASLLMLTGCTGKSSDSTSASESTVGATAATDPSTVPSSDESQAEATDLSQPADTPVGGRRLPEGYPGTAQPPVSLFEEVVAAAPATGGRIGASVSMASPILARGPVRIGPGNSAWHTIDRPPSNGGGKGKHSTYPNGSRDSDMPSESTYLNGDGSVDSYSDDGWATHTEKNGEGYVEDPKGDRTYFDEDGGQAEPGKGKYTDKDGKRTYFDEDGGSIEIPEPTYGPPPGKGPSGGTGEPHYVTESGQLVSSQRIGDFVLSDGSPGRKIHARVLPWNDSRQVSAISALAVSVGPSTLVVEADGTVAVDGTAAPDGPAVAFGVDGDDGGIIGVYRDESSGVVTSVTVMWNDLSAMWITSHGASARWLDFVLQGAQRTGQTRGILGSDSSTALTARDGAEIDVKSADAVDGFVRSWRVGSDDATLFSTAFPLPASVASAGIDAFPFPGEAAPKVDGATLESACGALTEPARTTCRFDLGATGEMAFAEGAKDFATLTNTLSAQAASVATAVKLGWLLDGSLDTPVPAPAQPSTSKAAGAGDGAIVLTAQDRAGAVAVDANGEIIEILAAGASKVFSFEAAKGQQAYAFSRNLSCPNAPFDGTTAGYAYFGSDGAMLGSSRRACDDFPKLGVPGGTVFVKVVGPGEVNVDLNLV